MFFVFNRYQVNPIPNDPLIVTNNLTFDVVKDCLRKNVVISNAKGQLISKAIFHGFPYHKKPTKFYSFFALVYKMGQIKKKNKK